MYSFFSKIQNCFLKGIQKPCSLALLELLQFFYSFCNLSQDIFFCVIISLGHLLLFPLYCTIDLQYDSTMERQIFCQPKYEKVQLNRFLKLESCRGLIFSLTVVRLYGVTTELSQMSQPQFYIQLVYKAPLSFTLRIKI